LQKFEKLGINAFKNQELDLAITYFSLTERVDDEVLFLVNLCEVAKQNYDESDMLFEYYQFLKSEDRLDFKELNDILEAIEEEVFSELDDDLRDENAITYEDFKNIVLNRVGFKEGLTGVMTSTRLVLRNSDNFLDFIENLLDNGLVDAGISYFETFLEIHGSSSLKTKHIAEKIKNYEDRNKR